MLRSSSLLPSFTAEFGPHHHHHHPFPLTSATSLSVVFPALLSPSVTRHLVASSRHGGIHGATHVLQHATQIKQASAGNVQRQRCPGSLSRLCRPSAVTSRPRHDVLCALRCALAQRCVSPAVTIVPLSFSALASVILSASVPVFSCVATRTVWCRVGPVGALRMPSPTFLSPLLPLVLTLFARTCDLGERLVWYVNAKACISLSLCSHPLRAAGEGAAHKAGALEHARAK